MAPFNKLFELLYSLDGVRQDPRYHPEGDVLCHSLQAFDLARRETHDLALWAAALFHEASSSSARCANIFTRTSRA